MRRFLVLVKRELAAIAFNPATLFAAAFITLLDSFVFYLLTVRTNVPTANFAHIATFMLYSSLLLHSFAARHSFSAENANGTIETLFTAPVSRLTVVFAKYAALMIFVLIHLAHGIAYAALLSYGGNLDWSATFAALGALLAVGSLAMALGIFVSALTASSAAAAAGSCGILVFMALAADLDPYSGTAADVLHAISFVPHAKRWIGGLIDTNGIVYFATLTALFLFYAWLAVSSHEAQRKATSTTVRRRLTATYLLVCAGLAFLLLEAAVLNIEGYWDVGSQLGHNLFRVPRSRLIPLALAAVSFGWALLTFRAARRAYRGERYKRNTTKKYSTISESQVHRALRYYYNENVRARRRIVFAAIAALAIAVNLNWLARYPFRTFADGGRLSFLTRLQSRNWDATREKRNTLAPATTLALDNLQGKLQIYSFLPDDLRVRNVPVAASFRSLAARYTDTNALVSAVYADTRNEPDFARGLALELDLPPENLENNVVVSYQGRHMTVPAESLAAAPDTRQRNAGDARWVFDGESQLTQAILNLTDPRVPRVFFTYGHLEHSQSSSAAPNRSVSRFVQALSGMNIRSRQHSFASGPIPPDCDVLAVVAPKIPFRKEEAEEIERYLDNGGRLLAIAPPADPDFPFESDPFNRLLFDMGGSFRDDDIYDMNNNDGDAFAIYGRVVTGHAEGSRIVFPDARSIQDNPRSPEKGWMARRMMQSFPSAVATAIKKNDIRKTAENDVADGAGFGIARPEEVTAGGKSGLAIWEKALGRTLRKNDALFGTPVDEPGARKGPFTLAYRTVRHTAAGEARALVIASAASAANSSVFGKDNLPLLVANTQWLAGREEAADIDAREWVDRRLRLTGPKVRLVIWIALVALPLAWLAAGISSWWLRRE